VTQRNVDDVDSHKGLRGVLQGRSFASTCSRKMGDGEATSDASVAYQLPTLGMHQIDADDAINDADRNWLQQSLENKIRPKPGDRVILRECPAGLLDDLPPADQQAISDIIGKPVRLNVYDDDGRAELEFTDADGVIHFLFVRPEFIGTA
jgi:hypothetical protein